MRVGLKAGQRRAGQVSHDQRRPSWRGVGVGLAAVAAVALSTLSPASGQTSGVTYTFSPQSGPAGTAITFSGTGCPPQDPNVTRAGRFTIFRSVDGSTSGAFLDQGGFRPNADGSFSGRIESVRDGPLGPHRTTVECPDGGASLGSFTLTAAGPATVLITEIEPICGAPGTARNIIRMITSQGLTGHVEDRATHETVAQFEQATAGEKRLGVGKQFTVVDVKVDSPASGETHTLDFGHCSTGSPTPSTVAAGGTSGTSGGTVPTTTQAAESSPVVASALPGEASLVAATRQTATTTPTAALATTGADRVEGSIRLAAASFMLGLLCMFVTPRRRFRQIDAWLSWVFNTF